MRVILLLCSLAQLLVSGDAAHPASLGRAIVPQTLDDRVKALGRKHWRLEEVGILHPSGRRSVTNVTNSSSKALHATTDYACNGCISTYTDGSPVSVRVMFLESIDTVVNTAANQATKDQACHPYCCSDPATATPECFVSSNWAGGWIGKPIMTLLESLGGNVIAMSPANFSDNVYNYVSRGTNAYTTCVWAVFIGEVDLCVGSFWETAPRRNMVLFTSPIDVNVFSLLTTATLQVPFSASDLLSIGRPFEWDVWVLVGVMFAFSALCMWIVSHEPNDDFDEVETFPQPRGLVKGFWVSAMGYLAGNQFVTNVWSKRMIVFGFSFFIYISGASYTANLASFMVLGKTAVGQISSFADIVSLNKKLCIPPEIKEMMTTPGMSVDKHLVLSNSVDTLIDKMRAGQCDAITLGKLEVHKFITAETAKYSICTTEGDFNYMGAYFCGDSESVLRQVDVSQCLCPGSVNVPSSEECPSHCAAPGTANCDIVQVPDPSWEGALNFALPVQAWVEPYISAWIVAMKQTGAISIYYEDEFLLKNPSVCPATTPVGQAASDTGKSNTEATALGLDAMAGTYFFSGIMMISGLLLHYFQGYMDRRNGNKVTALKGVGSDPASPQGKDIEQGFDRGSTMDSVAGLSEQMQVMKEQMQQMSATMERLAANVTGDSPTLNVS